MKEKKHMRLELVSCVKKVAKENKNLAQIIGLLHDESKFRDKDESLIIINMIK